MEFNRLLHLLQQTPDGDFFNPWYQRDKEHDRTADAPDIRKRQLLSYLGDRENSAKYLFIAEALGYQGGHFTGIAMTSERILLGHHEDPHDIPADGVFRSTVPRRTSKPSVNPKGMTEPTATIMWKAIYRLGIDPYETVLWNALAWHPYDSKQGLLSNRTPGKTELEAGYEALSHFLKLFPDRIVIAVGRKAEQCLSDLNVPHQRVRHPANGGAPKFRKQLKTILNRNS